MKSLPQLYDDVCSILHEARKKTYAAVNSEMVMAYWKIGKRIVEEEQSGNSKANYGAYLIRELSLRLTVEYGKGFAESNIKNFRQLYLVFPENEIRYALRSELTWTHYRSIMRVDDPAARKYYIGEAANQRWSTRQLDRNINTMYYERLLSTRNKRQALLQRRGMERASPQDIIKDPYVLEFLGAGRPTAFSENELETAIISNLQPTPEELKAELEREIHFLNGKNK